LNKNDLEILKLKLPAIPGIISKGNNLYVLRIETEKVSLLDDKTLKEIVVPR